MEIEILMEPSKFRIRTYKFDQIDMNKIKSALEDANVIYEVNMRSIMVYGNNGTLFEALFNLSKIAYLTIY